MCQSCDVVTLLAVLKTVGLRLWVEPETRIQYIPASPPLDQIRAVTQTADRISRKLGWKGR